MATKTYEISLVQKLRARRQQLKISQARIAKKLGMSFMNISHIERGRRGVKLDTLMKWAEILHLKIEVNLLELKVEANQQ